MSGQAKIIQKLGDTRLDGLGGHIVQLCVQIKVLAYGELAIKREVLRHETDPPAGFEIASIGLFAKQPRLALGGGQEAGQHFHRRRFSASVRAKKPENLTAPDFEAHIADGGKITKALGQPLGDNHRTFAFDLLQRGQFYGRGLALLALRQQQHKSFLQRVLTGLTADFVGGAGGQDAPTVHRHQPVKAFGLFHIGRRDKHAHARPARADVINQIPELLARQRVDARGRLVEDQKIGVMDQSATQP